MVSAAHLFQKKPGMLHALCQVLWKSQENRLILNDDCTDTQQRNHVCVPLSVTQEGNLTEAVPCDLPTGLRTLRLLCLPTVSFGQFLAPATRAGRLTTGPVCDLLLLPALRRAASSAWPDATALPREQSQNSRVAQTLHGLASSKSCSKRAARLDS